jgi:RNA polymerase sigma-70 factor (ECF subfamily)
VESLILQGVAKGTSLLAIGDDKILLDRFVAGEREAFEQFVALHGPRVSRLAYRLLGWHGDVDDIVQDVFVAALENGHKFRGDSGLQQWITTITLNKCRSHLRRKFLKLKWLRSRSPEEPSDVSSDVDPLRDETSSRVRTAVRALPPRDREVIVLYYLEDRTVAQMSQLLGDSENAIDVRLHRARKKLKELLGEFMRD